MPFLTYKIANSINEKLYVGCTSKSIEERWKGHLYNVRKQSYTGTCSALYTAMREYGIDTFFIEQIEEYPDDATMRNQERYWIRRLSCMVPNGYNLSVRLLTDEQVAIIRFNAYGLSLQGYADLFGVSPATIHLAKTGKGSNFRSDPFAYITSAHLPS